MKKPILISFLMASAIAFAQQYRIDWSTIDGGGGVSTGGVYQVSGTIGQPDAGTMAGGNFRLAGGFWGIIAIQTPGAPLLTINPGGSNTVIISWPSPSTGFGLQANSNLATTNWHAVALSPSDNGVTKSVIVPKAPGNKFYRLKE